MKRTLKWTALNFVSFAIIGVGIIILATQCDMPHVWWERLNNETPPAKVKAYIRAVVRDDGDMATQLWPLDCSADDERIITLCDRRDQVTGALMETDTRWHVTIRSIEWWSTCCEPGIINAPEDAGLARLHVSLSNDSEQIHDYVFDVQTKGGPYWGAAMGYPVRQWEIRDVYLDGETPLSWQWAATRDTQSLDVSVLTEATHQIETDNPTAFEIPVLSTWVLHENLTLHFTLRHPPEWTVTERGNGITLTAPQMVVIDSELIPWSIWVSVREKFAEDASLYDVIVNDYHFEAVFEQFEETLMEETINGRTVYRSTIIPAFGGQVSVFFDDGDRFVEVMLRPYDEERPHTNQEAFTELFAMLLETVEFLEKSTEQGD